MCGKASSARLLFFKGIFDPQVLQQNIARCGTVKTAHESKSLQLGKLVQGKTRERGGHIADQWRQRNWSRFAPPSSNFFLAPLPGGY